MRARATLYRLTGAWVLLLPLLIAGCAPSYYSQGRRAADDSRLDEAVERAQVAEDAAARNAARILELDDRIDALEAAVNELRGTTDVQADE